MLQVRARLFREIRAFFAGHGFLEVDTPLLSADTVIDRYLDPLPVTVFGNPCRPEVGRRMWLQTSPEFHMKRLMASGADAIFQITRAFRAGEVGPLHNPEFTIVEWYRRDDSMAEGMQLLSDLAEAMLHRGAAEIVTYADAFRRHAGVDPHSDGIGVIGSACHDCGIAVPDGMAKQDRDEWLNLLMGAHIQDRLGRSRPTIICDFPESQAALAQVRPGDPAVAERFELFVDGVELANGYHELLDAEALEERNRQTNTHRGAAGKYQLPEDSRLLDAMRQGLPKCAGVALGFDRLVMLATGNQDIGEVLPFPFDRA